MPRRRKTVPRYIPSKMRRRLTDRAIRNARVKVPCEVEIPGVCDPDAHREIHHRRMWSRGGRHTYANLTVCCLECHQFIHANVRWSIRLGLLTLRHPRRYWRRREVDHLPPFV